jgi:hypothetical protein
VKILLEYDTKVDIGRDLAEIALHKAAEIDSPDVIDILLGYPHTLQFWMQDFLIIDIRIFLISV